METFNLPDSDERFLRLTAREAMEQILLKRAISAHLQDLKKAAEAPDEGEDPQREVRTDEEGQQLADTPHLTGDPEFDAIELSEAGDVRSTDYLEEWKAYTQGTSHGGYNP